MSVVFSRGAKVAPVGYDDHSSKSETRLSAREDEGYLASSTGDWECAREELHLQQLLAKVFKDSIPEALEAFQTEFTALRRLRHAHTVQLLGACTGCRPYILIFELSTGGTLADAFRCTRAFTTKRAICLALDLAKALAYLHGIQSGPLVHRDLKPGNLLIAGPKSLSRAKLVYEVGRLKLADFGLAKQLPTGSGSSKRKFEMTGETGSYRYMAPETVLHRPSNEKVDCYGFAMVLYQLIEGRAPFADTDAVTAAGLAAIEGRRPPLYKFNEPNNSMPALRDLLESCWQECPDARPDFSYIVLSLTEILSYSSWSCSIM